jgi:HEAT repeat protein
MRKKGVFTPKAESQVEQLFDDLSAGEAVDEIVRALEDGTVAPDAEELSALFLHLRPVALAALFRGSEETKLEGVRQVLRRAIRGIAEGNREVVIRLITNPEISVASGAIRLAGKMGISEASGSLAKILDHGSVELRKVVLETAEEMPSSALAGSLQRLLRDSDRELRVGAARVLGKTKYAPAAQELRQILEDKEFRQADVTEKISFFEAYGLLAGESAVGFLDKILNGRGFLGRREPAELRAGAALGLGKARTASALQALETARKEEDPIVRSAVNRALKGGD